MADSRRLIDSLRDPRCYAHVVSGPRIVETHASWVILTGEHAYKIKKPVDFGFLDYSTLEKRRLACEEELRLNRVLAPELYLEVLAVTGSPTAPVMGGAGEALEYAVHMRQFEQDAQLDRLLEAGSLTDTHMDATARYIAGFHLSTPAVDAGAPFGHAADIHASVRDNIAALRSLASRYRREMDALQRWSEAEYATRQAYMDERRRTGKVRECHGDLHLANLALYAGRILAFDRIEFSESFRWLDVMDDCAFLAMDLMFHERMDLAFHFLNVYLEQTGDYPGLALLRYYLVYRALVRAKVSLLRSGQTGDDVLRDAATRDAGRHIELAYALVSPSPPRLVVMHGLSGSGKSWLSGRLMSALPGIRLRSDIERKRLHGLAGLARSQSEVAAGLYDEQTTRRTYAGLLTLTETLLSSGWPVIVDAAFLAAWQRDMFHEASVQLNVPLTIVNCQAPEAVLRQRVKRRSRAGSDASEADARVLEHQLRGRVPLSPREQALSLTVDTRASADIPAIVTELRRRTERL